MRRNSIFGRDDVAAGRNLPGRLPIYRRNFVPDRHYGVLPFAATGATPSAILDRRHLLGRIAFGDPCPQRRSASAAAALPIESAALRLMIDDSRTEQRNGDPNLYIVGTMPSRVRERPHRIVATLQTRDGTRSAVAPVLTFPAAFRAFNMWSMPAV